MGTKRRARGLLDTPSAWNTRPFLYSRSSRTPKPAVSDGLTCAFCGSELPRASPCPCRPPRSAPVESRTSAQDGRARPGVCANCGLNLPRVPILRICAAD